MELPKRKAIRLPEYDYSAPGAYFITICTQDRKCILSDIAVGALHEAPAASVRLTEIGRIVQGMIKTLDKRYPNVVVDKYVIMPNHVHLLLRIGEERALREAPLQAGSKRSLLGKVIGYLKMNSSKQIHARLPDLDVWQRSFYEHVIRNEADYRETWDYIDGNPAKRAEDEFYTE